MKLLLLLSILLISSFAEDVKCLPEQRGNDICIEIYSPVCGKTIDGIAIETYSNYCFACSNENVAYYTVGECLKSTSSSSSNNTASSSPKSSTTSSITKCPTPKNPNQVCDTSYKQTCGLFSDSIQCLVAPCGQEYSNECEACKDEKVESYYFGSCQTCDRAKTIIVEECSGEIPETCTLEYTDMCGLLEYPCEQESCTVSKSNKCDACSDSKVKAYYFGTCQQYLTFIQSTVVKNLLTKTKECTDPRPEVCSDFYIATCAFTTQPCFSENCATDSSNGCSACGKSNVKSYIEGMKCLDYFQQLEKYKQESGLSTTSSTQSCTEPRAMCDDTTPRYVCGLSVNCQQGSNCERTFTNSCVACADETISQYYDGRCKSDLNISLIISIGVSLLLVM